MKHTLDKDELLKAVDLELQWLKYYATQESRLSLNNESSIYDQLVSIGYAKKDTELIRRCGHNRYNSLFEKTSEPRNGLNVFTALEIYLLNYPEEFETIYKTLT